MNDLQGIPLGLGMALAKNANALIYFASLPNERRQQIIDKTHAINSSEEMDSFVSSLIDKK